MAGLLAGCGKRVETFREGSEQVGYASWYGGKFHGRKTASGERYDMHTMTAAHRTAPFGTQVRVRNLSSNKSTVVRINDRGPFVRGRIIDLSLSAAREIDLVNDGTAKVELQFLGRVDQNFDFYIQVGSFREDENARRRKTEILDRFPSASVHVRTSEDLHRIWIGPYREETKAVQMVKNLHRKGYPALILRR